MFETREERPLRGDGATHFIDDRLDVLEHLVGLAPRLCWFGYQAKPIIAPEPVRDWSETRALIFRRM